MTKLIFLLTSLVMANPPSSKIKAFSEQEIVKSSLKLPNGIEIKFQRGSKFKDKHEETLLVANWSVAGKPGCCEQELFSDITDGSDKEPVEAGPLIAWRVFHTKVHSTGLTQIDRNVHCWEFSADKTKLTPRPNCIKPGDNRFPRAKE